MTTTVETASARPAALGWRLLALVYDILPMLAVWFATSAVIYAVRGGAPVIPGSLASWAELLALWAVTGLYAVESWHRGGQTLGMRPWHLKVLGMDGRRAPRAALWRRFGVGTLSLLAGGLGFWWALFEREHRTWHDLASGTVFVRMDRRS